MQFYQLEEKSKSIKEEQQQKYDMNQTIKHKELLSLFTWFVVS